MDQQDLQNLPMEQLLNQIVALIFELCRRFCVRVEAPLPFTEDLEIPLVCGFHCRYCSARCARRSPAHGGHSCYNHRHRRDWLNTFELHVTMWRLASQLKKFTCQQCEGSPHSVKARFPTEWRLASQRAGSLRWLSAIAAYQKLEPEMRRFPFLFLARGLLLHPSSFNSIPRILSPRENCFDQSSCCILVHPRAPSWPILVLHLGCSRFSWLSEAKSFVSDYKSRKKSTS